MFLIKYDKDAWVNAEKITSVWISNGNLKFTIVGDGAENVVNPYHKETFINNINALDTCFGLR